MNNVSYINTIKKNWEIVALLSGIAIVVALVVSLFQPFQYKASTKLLVIQSQNASIDAYTATKSAEKIGKNLSQVVSSSSFYNDVIAVNPEIANEFSSDESKRRTEWKEDVVMAVVPETGILELTAYNEQKGKASEIVQTVTSVLLSQSAKYHGGGDSVSIQVIDDVFVYKYPVRPNILLNIIFAGILGFVGASIFILLNEARRIRTGVYQKSLLKELKRHKNTKTHDVDMNLSEAENSFFDVTKWEVIEEAK